MLDAACASVGQPGDGGGSAGSPSGAAPLGDDGQPDGCPGGAEAGSQDAGPSDRARLAWGHKQRR
eukprot:5203709-Alexandrium_andersonii.AAC.1